MSTDATQVSGSPLSGEGPRPGDVLAERYELLELIDLEGPTHGYRALDQETERVVLVRILAGAGLHTDECDALVDRLQGMLGVGGRYLSSLLDADRERRSPFTVEGWPPGMQLSAILDGRRGRGQVLGAREALPVVARLDAALTALPDGWAHGDVRPERVWLDADGLRLTTPYLLTALPHDELTDRVADLGPGAMAYAPELATKAGRPSPASDRWGVASIAWEALTGRSVDPGPAPPEIPPAHITLGDKLGAGGFGTVYAAVAGAQTANKQREWTPRACATHDIYCSVRPAVPAGTASRGSGWAWPSRSR